MRRPIRIHVKRDLFHLCRMKKNDALPWQAFQIQPDSLCRKIESLPQTSVSWISHIGINKVHPSIIHPSLLLSKSWYYVAPDAPPFFHCLKNWPVGIDVFVGVSLNGSNLKYCGRLTVVLKRGWISPHYCTTGGTGLPACCAILPLCCF